MKSIQKILSGILKGICVAAVVYFTLIGLQVTRFLGGVPIAGALIAELSTYQIFMLACFAGIFYYAVNFLKPVAVQILASIFIFTLLFWGRDRLPEFWQVLVNFWNGIVGIFTG